MANTQRARPHNERVRPGAGSARTLGFDRQGGVAMLVLTRKSNQSIMIGDEIEVSVLSIMGEKVRIGIQAPRDIPVFRKEVYLEIQQENMAAGASARAEVDDALKRLSSRS
jgi:carbon storage regulator